LDLSNESIAGLVKGDVKQQYVALDDVGAAAALALEVFLCVPMCSQPHFLKSYFLSHRSFKKNKPLFFEEKDEHT